MHLACCLYLLRVTCCLERSDVLHLVSRGVKSIDVMSIDLDSKGVNMRIRRALLQCTTARVRMCCKVCFCNTVVLEHSTTARPKIFCKHTYAETWTYKDMCREIDVQSRGRRDSQQLVQGHTRWLDTPRLLEPAPLPDSFPHTFHCVVDASFACFTQ